MATRELAQVCFAMAVEWLSKIGRHLGALQNFAWLLPTVSKTSKIELVLLQFVLVQKCWHHDLRTKSFPWLSQSPWSPWSPLAGGSWLFPASATSLPALWGSGCAGAPGIGTKAVGICEGFDFSMAWYGTKFEYVYLCWHILYNCH